MLVDDPLLTVRGVHRERPLPRVVLDRRLRMPLEARLFSTLSQGPVMVLTTESAVAASPDRAARLRDRGAQLEVLPGPGIVEALRYLGSRGVTSALVEGGAAVHESAWEAGVVDMTEIHIAPRVLGEEGVPWLPGRALFPASLFDPAVWPCGPDVVMTGYVHGID